jgi:hypothetical protein
MYKRISNWFNGLFKQDEGPTLEGLSRKIARQKDKAAKVAEAIELMKSPKQKRDEALFRMSGYIKYWSAPQFKPTKKPPSHFRSMVLKMSSLRRLGKIGKFNYNYKNKYGIRWTLSGV